MKCTLNSVSRVFCSTVTADPVPQLSPTLFRQVDEDIGDDTGAVILSCLKHFDSYVNDKNGLRQIHRSAPCKPGSGPELLCNKGKM